MTVNNIAAGVTPEFRAAATRFFLPGAAEFSSTLNLGQIIKGQVMRQYDGNRYLVDFGGHERVVDSTVPLTTGELIHGRVVALGDRVEVQRVYPRGEGTTETPAVTEPAGPVGAAGPFGRGERVVDQIAVRYRAELSAADKSVLLRAARTASDPNAMALVGAMVNKLGLRQSPDLLWPVYRALLRENAPSAALYSVQETTQLVSTTAADAGVQAASVRALAEALIKHIDQNAPHKEADDAPNVAADATRAGATPAPLIGPKAVNNREDDDRPADPRWMAQRLLNVQTGGAVMHRIGTVPLILGDQLVEVDLAFFEQRRNAAPASQTQHRKLMFSLTTEQLGNVEISASVVGSRVRLRVAAGDQDATAELAAHAEDLRAALAAGNHWEVDEVVYETRQSDSHNGVVRSVVEHVITQDSLNRLI